MDIYGYLWHICSIRFYTYVYCAPWWCLPSHHLEAPHPSPHPVSWQGPQSVGNFCAARRDPLSGYEIFRMSFHMKEGSDLHIWHSRRKNEASNINGQVPSSTSPECTSSMLNSWTKSQPRNHLKVCCRLLQPSLRYWRLDKTKLDYSISVYWQCYITVQCITIIYNNHC